MRSLARYILAGPMQASLVVFGFGLLSFPFPVFLVLSSAALVLVALQLGIKQGLSVLAICSILISVGAYFVFAKIALTPIIAWLSALVVTSVYRNSQSLNLTMQLITVFGLVVVVLISILIPDLQNQWLKLFQTIFEAAKQDPSFNTMLENAHLSYEKIGKYLPILASIITGGLVSVYLFALSATLFLGRWWQGTYTNIQMFRKEFIALRLGKVLAILAVLLLVAALTVKHAILWQLAIVCLGMFSLQGLANMHAFLGQLSSPMFGFIAVYGLLLIAIPQMVMVLSALGIVDAFINFRTRFIKSNT